MKLKKEIALNKRKYFLAALLMEILHLRLLIGQFLQKSYTVQEKGANIGSLANIHMKTQKQGLR